MQNYIIIISFNLQLLFLSGLQLSVNFWGDFAYKMQGFLDNNPYNLRIIVIIQFAKLSVNLWGDRKLYLPLGRHTRQLLGENIRELTHYWDLIDRPRSLCIYSRIHDISHKPTTAPL
uniref:Uncharacterized protein n=1 Tax=Lactuca sativa TaxID=4236 RepID=A0A9R1WEK0_LACSA|nr:hypothetical protein LSAT_V11C200053820 [Lactuca sativa]